MPSSRSVGVVCVASVAAFSLAGPGTVAVAQETTRVNVDSNGVQADGPTPGYGGLSANGMIAAFDSSADNLVAGDTNAVIDVFVHDRTTGITERASVDSSGVQGNSYSLFPAISADGQSVAFLSSADNLVPNDKNKWADVFVRDRSAGTTELVSVSSSGVQGNSSSGLYFIAISADGRIVAFDSTATNLVPGDTNGKRDIFVHDRSNGLTERVSVDSSGMQVDADCLEPAISSDGSLVAFVSTADDLVSGDTNSKEDVFVHDRNTGATERVSIDSSGAQGDGDSFSPSLSSDGRCVAFGSLATNLVTGDTNGKMDCFVHDRSTGLTERVSVDSSGAQGDNESRTPLISADGVSVGFSSWASNLVAGDLGWYDVFVHHRITGATVRVSDALGGGQAVGDSFIAGSSADGTVISFVSTSDDLVSGDTNFQEDLFVHELCSTAASWSNYGSGFAGTNGVPNFTSRQNPAFGAAIDLDLDNSSGAPTFGLLFVGFQRTSLHSSWGGDLLVVPALALPIGFSSSGGDTFSGVIPNDWTLCGVTVDLQAVEADGGATKGVSFTAGLELVIGE